MKKLICYINSAGENVNYENFQDTIKSIFINAHVNIDFYIVTDKEEHKNKFLEIFDILKYNVKDIKISNLSWAKNFNSFFNSQKNEYEYILVSHDDLVVKTFDFFNLAINQIENYENEIGWIGFTSDVYYKKFNALVSQSAREFFCLDRNASVKFELHKMINYNENLLDLPKKVCKVPGIYSHFNLIKSENLEKIGPCTEFGKYTLLIDEDWSIRTLIKNMWTVWIPNVFYDHPIRYEQRKIPGIQNQSDGVCLFVNKWGYNPGQITEQTIQNICNKYPNTNINFFNNKHTFDYQYF